VAVPVTNSATGTLDVLTGTLSLTGGGNFSNTAAVTSPAVLDFGGGTDTLNSGFSVTGTGTAQISGATVSVFASPLAGTFVSLTNFTQTAGTLSNLDTVNVTGTLTWTFGTITGVGIIRTQGPTSVMSLSGSTKTLSNGQTLEVGGTGSWSGGTIQVGGAGTSTTFRIASGATFDITANVSMTDLGGTSALDVQGTLRRNTATGTATISVPVVTIGPVQVQTGTLSANAGGNWGSGVTADLGATMNYSGGTHDWVPGFTGLGDGTLQISGGTVAANADLGIYSIKNLTITAGVFDNAATLELSGNLTWEFGTIQNFGTARVLPGGTMTLSSSTKTLVNQTLENQGTATWSGGTIQLNAATVSNVAGATFDVTANVSMTNIGGSPLFTNAGTLARTSATGIATISVSLTHTGGMNIQTGTMSLTAGGSLNGTATVAAGAVLNLNGGPFTATGAGFDVTGDLTVGNSTFLINGTQSSVTGNLTVSGSGILNMTVAGSVLDVDGNATFSGASTAGLLTTGTLQIGGNFTQSVSSTGFQASSGHVTEFNGTGAQSISFSNSGFTGTQSRFGTVRFLNSLGTVTFTSNAAASVFEDATTGVQEKLAGSAAQVFTARGLNVSNVQFDNLRFTVDTVESFTTFNTVTFINYPTNPDILTFRNDLGSFTFSGLSFPTTGFTGNFVVLEDIGAASPFLSVSLVSAIPSSPGTQCTLLGGATLSWNGANQTC
jgi:hypothetical protein